MITKDTPVESILDLPGVIAYCIKNGVSPYTCAGSYPLTLGKLLETRRVPDPEGFIQGLNEVVEGKTTS